MENVKVKRVRSLVAVCAMVLQCSAVAWAGDTLPLYPHADHGSPKDPVDPKIMNQAMRQGEPASMYTDDAPKTVMAWYSQRLPKSCTKNSEDDFGGQFTCPTRRLTVEKYLGRTIIAIVPRS
jgi:hypothetical protein